MHAPTDLTACKIPSSSHAVLLAAEEADAYRTQVKTTPINTGQSVRAN